MKLCLTRMCFALWLGGTGLLSVTGCARSSYMGISMIPGATVQEVQMLVRRAQTGNKRAQLDLGIRFEEGNGVPQDSGRAIKLYRMASIDSGGRVWVYAPPLGKGRRGTVQPIGKGLQQRGLAEAASRLKVLEQAKKYENSTTAWPSQTPE